MFSYSAMDISSEKLYVCTIRVWNITKDKEIKFKGDEVSEKKCGVTHLDQVRNEAVQRTGVTRVGWTSRAVCVEVVWTCGDKEGLVAEENSRIWCKRCKVKRNGTNGMNRRCEKKLWMKEEHSKDEWRAVVNALIMMWLQGGGFKPSDVIH